MPANQMGFNSGLKELNECFATANSVNLQVATVAIFKAISQHLLQRVE
jgi:hypothetical protein